MRLPRRIRSWGRVPESWKPKGGVHATLDQSPWRRSESREVSRAVRVAFDELTEYVCSSPGRMRWLGENAIECFLNVAYAGSNTPVLQREAVERAREVLAVLTAPYLRRPSVAQRPGELQYLITLSVYSHTLYPQGGGPTAQLVTLANRAHARSSNGWPLGGDYKKALAAPKVSISRLYDLILWSTVIIDAQRVPNLDVPARARALVPTLWRFLRSYPLVGASAHKLGAESFAFYDMAYIATHIGYIPTGYGRHALRVEDAPWLYRFLRENFYPVLDLGELDLLSEFVDLLRQMGCTETNDLQVRDGARYLLRLFRDAGDSWIAHREPDETGRLDKYDEMHKPWTAIAGIRPRAPEPARPGTYGFVFRRSVGQAEG